MHTKREIIFLGKSSNHSHWQSLRRNWSNFCKFRNFNTRVHDWCLSFHNPWFSVWFDCYYLRRVPVFHKSLKSPVFMWHFRVFRSKTDQFLRTKKKKEENIKIENWLILKTKKSTEEIKGNLTQNRYTVATKSICKLLLSYSYFLIKPFFYQVLRFIFILKYSILLITRSLIYLSLIN